MTTGSSRRSPPDAPTHHAADPDPREVDRLYGLEPIFEPGGESGSALDEFVELQCPWCGERFDTAIELTTGDRTWIEDCQVCCRPMQVVLELDEKGAIASVSALRDH